MGKRPDREIEKLGFQVDFSSSFQLFSVEFSAIPASVPVGFVVNLSLGFSAVSGLKRKKNSRWLKLAIQTKIQLCVLPKFNENHHVRSGVVFTPKVGIEHVDRRWKACPVGNKGKPLEYEYGAAKC